MEYLKPAELTSEQLATLRPVEAPTIYANQFRVSLSSTDAMIRFQRIHPVVGATDQPDLMAVVDTGILSISLHSLKDLALLLNQTVEGLEKDYGPIITDFSRKKAEAAKKPGRK